MSVLTLQHANMPDHSRRDSKTANVQISDSTTADVDNENSIEQHNNDASHTPLQESDIVPKSILQTAGTVKVEKTTSFTLCNPSFSPDIPEITLDYGLAIGGTPIFHLLPTTEELQFQTIYSETHREISNPTGDGPFFLFSNAMDSYRCVTHTVPACSRPQTITARHAQRAQRYQRIRLLTPDSSLTFSAIGFQKVRAEQPPKASFYCSDPLLNKIWLQGARTVDLCTVQQNETQPAWDITEEGTRVYGQHWAPCRMGTRWGDKKVRFEVKIEEKGASWGVHMVANGLILLLHWGKRRLEAFEGLAHEQAIFPSRARGEWTVDEGVDLKGWIAVETLIKDDTIRVSINGTSIAQISNLNIHPLLGGSPPNTGSIAFGGPQGWISTYRNLLVSDPTNQKELYRNSLLPSNQNRTLADFAVGTNSLPCTIDGAKRDRATFGGDLHIMGRSIPYSTAFHEAVKGSIELLTSHQTEEGYLGNLCPIQAPVHGEEEGNGEPPTYAFYSLTYALLLVVAIKDYWMFSGDESLVRRFWPKMEKLKAFVEGFRDAETGLIAAPPELSLGFFPLVGPVMGISTMINLAFVDMLRSMGEMAGDDEKKRKLEDQAEELVGRIREHLWDEKSGVLRLSDSSPLTGLAQDVNGYGILLGVNPKHEQDLNNLTQLDTPLPAAFKNLPRFSDLQLCSPYSSSFAIEACFARNEADAGLDMIRKIWGVMADEQNADFSGCHWEAMTLDGKPYHDSTSLVHGWSTSPVFLLPMYLAGLRPVEAGWRKWEVRPVVCRLERVRGSVPVPNGGEVRVEWSFDHEEGVGGVECKGAGGTKGMVYPPSGWLIEDCGKFSLEGVPVLDEKITRKLQRDTSESSRSSSSDTK